MTRNERTGKVEFGPREWAAMGSALVALFGMLAGGAAAWIDVRVKHEVAMQKLDHATDKLGDHETRIRRLEGTGVALGKGR